MTVCMITSWAETSMLAIKVSYFKKVLRYSCSLFVRGVLNKFMPTRLEIDHGCIKLFILIRYLKAVKFFLHVVKNTENLGLTCNRIALIHRISSSPKQTGFQLNKRPQKVTSYSHHLYSPVLTLSDSFNTMCCRSDTYREKSQV